MVSLPLLIFTFALQNGKIKKLHGFKPLSLWELVTGVDEKLIPVWWAGQLRFGWYLFLFHVVIWGSLTAQCSQVSSTSYPEVVYPQNTCSIKQEAEVSLTLDTRTGAYMLFLTHSNS